MELEFELSAPELRQIDSDRFDALAKNYRQYPSPRNALVWFDALVEWFQIDENRDYEADGIISMCDRVDEKVLAEAAQTLAKLRDTYLEDEDARAEQKRENAPVRVSWR